MKKTFGDLEVGEKVYSVRAAKPEIIELLINEKDYVVVNMEGKETVCVKLTCPKSSILSEVIKETGESRHNWQLIFPRKLSSTIVMIGKEPVVYFADRNRAKAFLNNDRANV